MEHTLSDIAVSALLALLILALFYNLFNPACLVVKNK